MKICEQVAHCCIFEQPQVIWLIVLWIVELPFTLPLLLTTIAVFSSVSCIPQKIPKIPPTITMKAIVNTIATHIIIGIAAFSLWLLLRLTGELVLLRCRRRRACAACPLSQCYWCQFQTCLLQLGVVSRSEQWLVENLLSIWSFLYNFWDNLGNIPRETKMSRSFDNAKNLHAYEFNLCEIN